MKRLLLVALVATLMLVTTSANVFAQDEDCPCGFDEEGECIPCDE